MEKNLGWFGEIERKLSMSNFTYRSSSNLFYEQQPLKKSLNGSCETRPGKGK
jgi:hypothetical protein